MLGIGSDVLGVRGGLIHDTPHVVPFEARLGPFPEMIYAASSRCRAPSCKTGHEEAPTGGSVATEIK